jgi:hypothetical protein
MRAYLKILFTTAGIQLAAVAVCYALFFAKMGTQSIPILIVIGYAGSLIFDIYRSVKMAAPWYKKLACIFLMPTNYTPLLLPVLAMHLFIKFFEMFPASMG